LGRGGGRGIRLPLVAGPSPAFSGLLAGNDGGAQEMHLADLGGIEGFNSGGDDSILLLGVFTFVADQILFAVFLRVL